MKILVSACLLGIPCRYDGSGNLHSGLSRLEQAGHTLIPVCPEVLGGLATPRPPAELQDGRVITRQGKDITQAFHLGAKRTLALAQREGCTLAILKERSPSCSPNEVYDGTFSRALIPGQGLTAALLAQAGIRVLGEREINTLLDSKT